MEYISSRQNPLCTHFKKLASSRSYREERGEFLCDSPKLLDEASRWGAPIRTVLFTAPDKLPGFDPAGVRMVQVSESVMKAVSPMETPQGVVFSCGMRPDTPPIEMPEQGRCLVLDGVQDPGNVGTILRTADAFGCPVLLLPGCADLYNPKTLRSAMGAHFRSVQWRCTLDEAVSLFQRTGIPLYATALREDTEDLTDAELSHAAVVIGSEGRGVSPQVLERCEKAIKIPMSPRCESLNAAVAAAVVLWEGFRGDAHRRTRPCQRL